MCDTGLYVYAVTRGLDPAALAGLTGLEGTTVDTIGAEGLQAVVGEVGMERFSSGALANNLEDIEWLETVARGHHRVVEAVCAQATALPLRLATLYLSRARVCGMLAGRRDALANRLDAITGCREWGVKAYATGGGPEAATNSATEATEQLAPGAAYLARRRGEKQRRAERQSQLEAEVHRIDRGLQASARDRRVYAPQSARLTGRGEPMRLNNAYLVATGREAEFQARVADCQRADNGLEVVLTGPWAPYSFAEARA